MAKSLLQKMKDLRKRGKDLGSYTTERKKRMNKSIREQLSGNAKRKKGKNKA